MKFKCPLCAYEDTKFYHESLKGKFKFKYYVCNRCTLVFMQRDGLLEASEESSRYLMHENNIRTSGYEKFLRELINPVLERISKDDYGLDYGSGPYPMLAQIVKEDGYHIEIFDPFFANDKSQLNKSYDYITCCEVVEHFHHPDQEFKKLSDLLKADGILGIRTNILYPNIEFKSWHYKEDDTHVVFYTPNSIKWICESYGLKVDYFEKNVVIFRKVTS